jgi:hypothetical protein
MRALFRCRETAEGVLLLAQASETKPLSATSNSVTAGIQAACGEFPKGAYKAGFRLEASAKLELGAWFPLSRQHCEKGWAMGFKLKYFHG